jgi:hypothetical protein
MDISLSLLAPVVVADLRPSADAAATARIDRPPAALAPGIAVAPVSFTQEGLVTRGLMEPEGPSPVAPLAAPAPTSGDAPQRVLKPWGVPMLPSEERHKPTDADEDAAPPPAQGTTDSAVPGPLVARDSAIRGHGGPADAETAEALGTSVGAGLSA